MRGTAVAVVALLLCLTTAGVVEAVPVDFTDIGDYFPPCQFASNASSPDVFNFDLSVLGDYEEGLNPAFRVLYEAPPDHTVAYYASTCTTLVVGAVPNFPGSCDGGSVCFCSSEFQSCHIVGNRSTMEWYVSTKDSLPLTVVQHFTSPGCAANAGLDWNSYLIYTCDESPDGYGAGTVISADQDQWGLCSDDNTGCSQCVQWSTNYACEAFPSFAESFIREGQAFLDQITAGSSTPTVATLVTRDQFGQAYTQGGAMVTLGVDHATDVLAVKVNDSGDGLYDIVVHAKSIELSAPVTYNLTVFLNGYSCEAFTVTVLPARRDGPNNTAIIVILVSVAAIVAVLAGVATYRMRRYGYIMPRRSAQPGFAAAATASTGTYGAASAQPSSSDASLLAGGGLAASASPYGFNDDDQQFGGL